MLSSSLRLRTLRLGALRPSVRAIAPRALFSSARASLASPAKAPSAVDQFATGNNAYYAEEMYKLWKEVSTRFVPFSHFFGMTKLLTRYARRRILRPSTLRGESTLPEWTAD